MCTLIAENVTWTVAVGSKPFEPAGVELETVELLEVVVLELLTVLVLVWVAGVFRLSKASTRKNDRFTRPGLSAAEGHRQWSQQWSPFDHRPSLGGGACDPHQGRPPGVWTELVEDQPIGGQVKSLKPDRFSVQGR